MSNSKTHKVGCQCVKCNFMEKIHKAIRIALSDQISIIRLQERFNLALFSLQKHFKKHGVVNISKLKNEPQWILKNNKLNCDYHL